MTDPSLKFSHNAAVMEDLIYEVCSMIVIAGLLCLLAIAAPDVFGSPVNVTGDIWNLLTKFTSVKCTIN